MNVYAVAWRGHRSNWAANKFRVVPAFIRLRRGKRVFSVEHLSLSSRVLIQPQLVRRSRSDEAVRLFYEFYARTIVGGKWLCVVVKYAENDAFVVTAYLTDKPKPGEDLWPIK